MSSDHHELGPAEAGHYARDVREATDRVLEEMRASIDVTLRRLAATIAGEARAAGARLSDAMRLMDEAPSLSGVLNALADAVGREAERSALLITERGRLKGWRTSGLAGPSADPRAIDISPDVGGLLGAAIRTKTMIVSPASTPRTPASERPQFAPGAGARDAVGAPLLLGGTVSGLVYADTPAARDSSWTQAIEHLTRYAGLVLEARTARYLTSGPGEISTTSLSGTRGASGAVW